MREFKMTTSWIYSAEDVQFTVKSMELRDYSVKHGCVPVSPVDENKLLVRLVPAVPSWVYQTVPDDLDRVVLAPRAVGKELVPAITEWPFIANICVPKPNGNWTSGPWSLLDIGLLEKIAG